MFIKLFKSKSFNLYMAELKQVILVRNDIKMSKGKACAQVAHAAVEATLSANKKLIANWRKSGMKKITLRVDSLVELLKFKELAQEKGFDIGLICDAGHTELEPGTYTCLAIGPAPETKIDELTGELKAF